MSRPIPDRAVKLVMEFEGFEPEPYLCSGGVATIGFGTTIKDERGRMVRDLDVARRLEPRAWSREMGVAALAQDLERFGAGVHARVNVPLTDNAFGGLVAFAYNVGIGAFADSTLLKYLNQGRYREAADQFLRWDKAGGRVLAGLTRRRRAERALFLDGIEAVERAA